MEQTNLRLIQSALADDERLLTDAVMALSALLASWPASDALFGPVAALTQALGTRLG